ncbi:MAG: hypothetical protein AB7F59_07820 [Bdellovibrionales bacterium]
MKIIGIIVVEICAIFLVIQVSANDCLLVEQMKLSMEAHKLNHLNHMCTRTPEGGPCKLKSVSCNGIACQVVDEARTRVTYEPMHPDASKEGYVSYPDIDRKSEWIAMSANAQVLKQLGTKCGVLVKDNGSSSIVAYSSASDVQLDVFNFDAQTNLAAWTRIYKNGATQVSRF